MASQIAAAPLRTAGGAFERRRLEHRARRIEFAITALRRLADTRAPDAPVPAPMRRVIDGLSKDLAQIDRRRAGL